MVPRLSESVLEDTPLVWFEGMGYTGLMVPTSPTKNRSQSGTPTPTWCSPATCEKPWPASTRPRFV